MGLLRLYIVLLFMLLSMVANSQNIYCWLGEMDTIESMCKIKKIKTSPNKTGYVIYAEAKRIDGKAKFVIVSPMDNDNNKKIRTNKQYYFKLYSYHPHKTVEGYRRLPFLVDYQEVIVNYRKIIIDKTHYFGEVYITPNLKGLHYCPAHNE